MTNKEIEDLETEMISLRENIRRFLRRLDERAPGNYNHLGTLSINAETLSNMCLRLVKEIK